ncbi:insulinase family protein, partial [Candidatus Kaiserbacteria bacterium]|nr:insulinase family protein [Candidatus Kaiserbacteria bacterium]
VIQEIDMYEDMPMRTVDNVFDELLFGKKHPLGRTILGPKENIRSFTRRDFAAYHKRNYVPLNTVVCVAGAFDKKKVISKIEKEFGGLPHGNPPNFISFTSEQNEPRIAIRAKKTDQTHFIIGVPAYPYLHKDEFALAVLSTVLGSGMSSRLFLEVREKRGLAYSVHAWVERYPDIGTFNVQAGVQHEKLEETIKTILTEFKKNKEKRVTAAELHKAKQYIKGTMTLSLETSDEIANHAASAMINIGRVRPLDEILTGIDTVTATDIQRVARDILQTNKLNLAIIGPHMKKEKFVSLLSA